MALIETEIVICCRCLLSG